MRSWPRLLDFANYLKRMPGGVGRLEARATAIESNIAHVLQLLAGMADDSSTHADNPPTLGLEANIAQVRQLFAKMEASMSASNITVTEYLSTQGANTEALSQDLSRITIALETFAEKTAMLSRELDQLKTAQENSRREILRRLLQARNGKAEQSSGQTPAPPPRTGFDIKQTLAKLEQRYPAAVAEWRKLSDNANIEYARDPNASLSMVGNSSAMMFKGFAQPYVIGRVLDIGCGPQVVPIYLESHPLDYVVGIDPFGDNQSHPFRFVRAMNEELPWPDATFDTVINSTSLDHCIDLDSSFSETTRVMKNGATFIVWVGFIKGAPEYNPETPRGVDKYHLYHFDRGWFETAINRYFRIVDRLDVDGESNFYALCKI